MSDKQLPEPMLSKITDLYSTRHQWVNTTTISIHGVCDLWLASHEWHLVSLWCHKVHHIYSPIDLKNKLKNSRTSSYLLIYLLIGEQNSTKISENNFDDCNDALIGQFWSGMSSRKCSSLIICTWSLARLICQGWFPEPCPPFVILQLVRTMGLISFQYCMTTTCIRDGGRPVYMQSEFMVLW